MAFPERITTARLVLHRWDTGSHLDGLAAVNAQPAAVTYLNDGIPYTREDSERQSDRFAAGEIRAAISTAVMLISGAGPVPAPLASDRIPSVGLQRKQR